MTTRMRLHAVVLARGGAGRVASTPAQVRPAPAPQSQAEIVQEGHGAIPERSDLPAPARPPVEGKPDDIVVIARRLRLMRLHYASSGRILAWCHADVSSGDKRVDRIGCAMLRACVREGNETRDTALTCLRRKIDEVAADADDAARPRG